MATKSANVTAHLRSEIERQAETIPDRIGLPASVLINTLYRLIIMTGSVPFPLAVPKLPTRDSLTDRQFNAMMGTGYYQAKSGELDYEDNYFDIGLSSHFLLMYTFLGYDFHIASMTETLRVCKEIRIFPIVDLDANRTDLTEKVIGYFKKDYKVDAVKTEYEFQKGDNKLLIIRK